MLGSLVAGKIIRVDSAASAVAWGMTAMAVSLGSIVVLPNFALIVAAGAIGGVGNGFVFIPWLLLIQHRTADAIRARVIAAAEAFDQIAFFAGMGLAVPALNLIGPHHAYALTGIMLVGAAISAVRAMLGPARTPHIAAA